MALRFVAACGLRGKLGLSVKVVYSLHPRLGFGLGKALTGSNLSRRSSPSFSYPVTLVFEVDWCSIDVPGHRRGIQ